MIEEAEVLDQDVEELDPDLNFDITMIERGPENES